MKCSICNDTHMIPCGCVKLEVSEKIEPVEETEIQRLIRENQALMKEQAIDPPLPSPPMLIAESPYPPTPDTTIDWSKVVIPQKPKCESCKDTGKSSCFPCYGTGTVVHLGKQVFTERCTDCKGAGKIQCVKGADCVFLLGKT